MKKNRKVGVAPTSANNGGDKLSSGIPAELAKIVSKINNEIQKILNINLSPEPPLITRTDTGNPSSAATAAAATVNSTFTATTAVNKSVATVGSSDTCKQKVNASNVTGDIAFATNVATSVQSKSIPSKKVPASNNARYPPHTLKRALIMREGSFDEVRKELQSRGFKIIMLRTSPGDVSWKSLLIRELRELHICKHDVVIANPMWVDVALKELGIPVPEPPDYPPCVSHMLRRKVWKSTLAQVRAALLSGQYKTLFIKPASSAKSFNGEVLHGPVDDVLECFLGPYYPHILPSQEVHCGEVVDMNSEYAVYLVDGFVRSICHYQCKRSTCRCCDAELAETGHPPISLDVRTVFETVRLLITNKDTQALGSGCRVDFGLVRGKDADGEEKWETVLIEVNDGYVAGRYDGMSVSDYTDMILSRFQSLQNTAVKSFI